MTKLTSVVNTSQQHTYEMEALQNNNIITQLF